MTARATPGDSPPGRESLDVGGSCRLYRKRVALGWWFSAFTRYQRDLEDWLTYKRLVPALGNLDETGPE